MNGVNQPEEMVTGVGRGQGNRVRRQKLCLFGTASLRTQTYFRSSLLSTHFGEEKRRPEIRLCPQAREQQGFLEEYRTWDKSQQQKGRNITRISKFLAQDNDFPAF